MPLNGQLTERGARRIAERRRPRHITACLPCPAACRPSPGLLRVADGAGARIALEVWEMPVEQYGSFVALIAAPLGIGTLQLADGRSVQGFLCEAQATAAALDISHFGGWRSYVAAVPAEAAP